MGKEDHHASGAVEGQIFELTMDNPEDQDELNCRLQKPGEPDGDPSTKVGPTAQGASTTDSAGKKKAAS